MSFLEITEYRLPKLSQGSKPLDLHHPLPLNLPPHSTPSLIYPTLSFRWSCIALCVCSELHIVFIDASGSDIISFKLQRHLIIAWSLALLYYHNVYFLPIGQMKRIHFTRDIQLVSTSYIVFILFVNNRNIMKISLWEFSSRWKPSTASQVFTDPLLNSPKYSPWFSPGYEGMENMFYFLIISGYHFIISDWFIR